MCKSYLSRSSTIFLHHRGLMMPVDRSLILPAVDQKYRFGFLRRIEILILQVAGFVADCSNCAGCHHFFGKFSCRAVLS